MAELPVVDVVAKRFDDLDVHELYALLRLRVDVFVVEQRCPYPELDGRDAEPGTLHCWLPDDVGVATYLRVLAETHGGTRIGRVATARRARGRGMAEQLVRTVLPGCERPVVLDAQAHLEAWYARLGFERAGEPFVEDGIPHVRMRLR